MPPYDPNWYVNQRAAEMLKEDERLGALAIIEENDFERPSPGLRREVGQLEGVR